MCVGGRKRTNPDLARAFETKAALLLIDDAVFHLNYSVSGFIRYCGLLTKHK